MLQERMYRAYLKFFEVAESRPPSRRWARSGRWVGVASSETKPTMLPPCAIWDMLTR